MSLAGLVAAAYRAPPHTIIFLPVEARWLLGEVAPDSAKDDDQHSRCNIDVVGPATWAVHRAAQARQEALTSTPDDS